MTRFLFIKSDTEVLSVPAENLFSLEYESAGKIALRFKTVRSGLEGTSKVVLNVTAGREQEVILDIDKQIKLPNKSFIYTDIAVSSNEKNRAGGFISRSPQKSTLNVLSIDSITHASGGDLNTTYTVSAVDGDNSDEEKIRLTGSDSSTDDVILEAGTGLTIARAADKITFSSSVTDTNLGTSDQTVSGNRAVNLGGSITFSIKCGSSNTLSPLVITPDANNPATIHFNGDLRFDSGLTAGGMLKLEEFAAAGNNFVALKAPTTLSGDTTFILPATDGSTGQFMKTDGAGNLSFATVTTTTLTQVYSQSFFDDISTLKHYLPFKDINEQSQVYQEEAAMLMPFDGRIKSVSLKGSQVANASGGNLTVGIETLPVGDSIFSASNWNAQETEVLAFGSADSNHVFHFVFDNAKHFDAGESCSISLQASADPGSNTYWHVTTIVEFDTTNNLGASSTEHETTP